MTLLRRHRSLYIVPAPAAPTLSAPADSAVLDDTTPDFSWSAVALAARYRIQIDDSSDFSSPVVDDATLVTTSFTPGSALDAGTTYYWRVAAINGAGVQGAWSATRTVVITIELPQYLTSPAPTLTENFETTSEWSVLTGSAVANAAQVKVGTQSIKVTSSSGTAGTITKTVNWDLSAANSFRIWAYLHDYNDTSNVVLYFSNDTTFSNYFTWQINQSGLHAGWNAIQLLKSTAASIGTPSWANNIVRFRVRVSAGASKTPSVSWDKFEVLSTLPTPAVMLMFDDGYDSTYSEAYAYCHPRRVTGTMFAITDLVGTAGKVTVAQMQEMDAGGWDIGNHTKSHPNLTTLSEADQQTEISAAQSALDGWGLTRASKHVAYPGGQYNNDTLTAMTAAGMLTGRTISVSRAPIVPPSDNYTVELASNVVNTTTLAQAKAAIDAAITSGTVCCLLFHHLVPSNADVSTKWLIADFQALVDYILQVQIQPITVSQFYNLQASGVVVIPPAW